MCSQLVVTWLSHCVPHAHGFSGAFVRVGLVRHAHLMATVAPKSVLPLAMTRTDLESFVPSDTRRTGEVGTAGSHSHVGYKTEGNR